MQIPIPSKNIAELNKEGNFVAISRASLRLTPSPLPWILTISFDLIFSTYVISDTRSTSDILKKLIEHASLGISFGSQILGFLLAGYALFTASFDRRLLRFLTAKTDTKNGNFPYIKSFSLSLIQVVISYSVFLLLSFTLIAVDALQGTSPDFGAHSRYLIKFVFFSYYSLLILITASLNSFIYNMYSTTMIRAEFEAVTKS